MVFFPITNRTAFSVPFPCTQEVTRKHERIVSHFMSACSWHFLSAKVNERSTDPIPNKRIIERIHISSDPRNDDGAEKTNTQYKCELRCNDYLLQQCKLIVNCSGSKKLFNSRSTQESRGVSVQFSTQKTNKM